MEEKIKKLLQTKNGYLNINRFTRLYYLANDDNNSIKDGTLSIVIKINGANAGDDFVRYISSRDVNKIIEMIQIYIMEAFQEAGDDLAQQVLNPTKSYVVELKSKIVAVYDPNDEEKGYDVGIIEIDGRTTFLKHYNTQEEVLKHYPKAEMYQDFPNAFSHIEVSED